MALCVQIKTFEEQVLYLPKSISARSRQNYTIRKVLLMERFFKIMTQYLEILDMF